MAEYMAIAFSGGQLTEEPKRYAYLGVLPSENEPNLDDNESGGFISLGYIYRAFAEDRMELRYKGPNLDDAKESIKGLEDLTNRPMVIHCVLSRAVPLAPKDKNGTQLMEWEVPFERY